MNSIKLISALLILLLSNMVKAQELSSPDILYDYQLRPTGSYQDKDTIYNLVLILEEADIKELETVILKSELSNQDLLVDQKAIGTDDKINFNETNYELTMGEVSILSNWAVTGVKKDGSTIVLKDRHLQISEKSIIQDVKSKTRDVGFYELDPVIEPEPPIEPQPSAQDTLGYPINQFKL